MREGGWGQHITTRLITLHHTGNVLSPPLPTSNLIIDETCILKVLWVGSVMGSLGVETKFSCTVQTPNLKKKSFVSSLDDTLLCHFTKIIHIAVRWKRWWFKMLSGAYGHRKWRWKTQPWRLDGRLTVLFKGRAVISTVSATLRILLQKRKKKIKMNWQTTCQLPGCACAFTVSWTRHTRQYSYISGTGALLLFAGCRHV